MIHVDLKYISLVGPQLRNFKKKKDGLYNCSCPVCGDSDKKKTKARGYFYQKSNSMIYKCHNCGVGVGIGNFLKINFPTYYNSYIFERYKTDYDSYVEKQSDESKKITISNINLLNSSYCNSIQSLPENHYAKLYVSNRKIDSFLFNLLFFTEDFNLFVNQITNNSYPNLEKNDPRLIIPFFSADNELIGFQGRSFGSEKKLRYITIRFNPEQKLIYGLNRFSFDKIGYVVEGPIDSLFLPNCIAAANSDLESICDFVKSDLVLIYDNEPRNREIVKLMESAIKNNKKICIWPKMLMQKDINEMILSGLTSEQIYSTIKSRTFCGLQAQLELLQWKKI